ncbi:MAG: fibrobacter succinogenes major paralogous domain-containing protein, partial [Bacteroidota bacterium]
TSGAYSVYEDEQKNDDLYGKLYNHYAVTDNRGLCPTGWHVPTDAEWTTLENQLGGSSLAGGALKSTATQPTLGGWDSPNEGATNSSGFSALPGGFRVNDGGDFYYITFIGFWWSSSVSAGSYAWGRDLDNSFSGIGRNYYSRTYGFSVRCC